MNEPCEQCENCDLFDLEDLCGCPCHAFQQVDREKKDE